MIPIAILGSGRGSNFDAIARAIAEKRLDARIVAVLSDREDAGILEKARALGLPALFVPALSVPALSVPALSVPALSVPALSGRPETPETKDERRLAHEERVVAALLPYAPRFLIMAGYMRIISPRLLQEFRSERGYSRIVNIHPSLLPAFPGVDGYRQAYQYGVKTTGATVHLVDEGLDSGPICAQESFFIGDCRSVAEVEARGLAVEHRLFSETLRWVLPEKFEIEVTSSDSSRSRRISVRPN